MNTVMESIVRAAANTTKNDNVSKQNELRIENGQDSGTSGPINHDLACYSRKMPKRQEGFRCIGEDWDAEEPTPLVLNTMIDKNLV